MTCLEYLNKITENGTLAALPKEVTEQHAITTGNDGQTSNGITVTCFRSESISEAKAKERLIEKLSLLVLNTPSDNCSIKRFFNHCMNVVPKDFRNGEYDKETWTEFVLSMALTISSKLTALVIKERHWKGADTLLKVLMCRIDAWNAKLVKVDDDEKKVTIVNFERF